MAVAATGFVLLAAITQTHGLGICFFMPSPSFPSGAGLGCHSYDQHSDTAQRSRQAEHDCVGVYYMSPHIFVDASFASRKKSA
jgi:hypothetical protein